jgi:hypothetical protein
MEKMIMLYLPILSNELCNRGSSFCGTSGPFSETRLGVHRLPKHEISSKLSHSVLLGDSLQGRRIRMIRKFE